MCIRDRISIAENAPIAEFFAAGLPPLVIKLCGDEFDFHADLQTEASWILINLMSGDTKFTAMMVKMGVIDVFYRLLRTTADERIKENALWGLGNVTGDDLAMRDYLLRLNIVGDLMELIANYTFPTSTLRNVAWIFSNVTRGRPYPPYHQVRAMLPGLATFIELEDEDILYDTIWCLSHLTYGENDQIQDILNLKITKRICKLLKHKSPRIRHPALRTVANILTGNESQTQEILSFNILGDLSEFLSSKLKYVRREAAWAVSNIFAGSLEQKTPLYETDIPKKLIAIILIDDLEVKKEALISFCNATYNATVDQIEYLVDIGVLEQFIVYLELHDPKMLIAILNALDNVLQAGEYVKQDKRLQANPFMAKIEEYGGFNTLENVQKHPDLRVYQVICGLIDKFFIAEAVGNLQVLSVYAMLYYIYKKITLAVGSFHM
eukprot:TRINITY_DN1773_c0_g4_i3.p1 TRINITY_DN1773_c0_g4~~TRINITY_DN1773_c0_g4_i3.p1  ORF type:complete len:437 (-),score=65.14 TRINITY_DN1773_c0_g4_i3:182-1492(-)